jgi:hypothetical protein
MILIYALACAGVAIIFLAYKYFSLLDKFGKNEFVQYVDTSGITQNPPQYIDLWEGKTINFKLDKWAIKINFLRPDWCFKYLRSIAENYQLLLAQAENGEKSVMETYVYGAAYVRIVQSVYDLSKHFVRGRRAYRKALIAKSKKDIAFVLNACEQMFDYWIYVKKKIALLAAQTTLRRTAGVSFADNSCKLGTDGKIYAIPRFEPGSNMGQ